MNSAGRSLFSKERKWHWPIDATQYDQSPQMSESEHQELDSLVRRLERKGKSWYTQAYGALPRLLQTPSDTLEIIRTHQSFKGHSNLRSTVIGVIVRAMHRLHVSFWAFIPQQWLDLLDTDYYAYVETHGESVHSRQHLIALSYLLCDFHDIHALGKLEYYALTREIFGGERLEAAVQSIGEDLEQWGYAKKRAFLYMREISTRALLANRSPCLEDLTLEVLESLYLADGPKQVKQGMVVISLVLHHRSLISRPIAWANQKKEEILQKRRNLSCVPAEWASLIKYIALVISLETVTPRFANLTVT